MWLAWSVDRGALKSQQRSDAMGRFNQRKHSIFIPTEMESRRVFWAEHPTYLRRL